MSDETENESTEPEEIETEDVDAHGVEVEDDTEAAVLDVNFGCGKAE